MSTTVSVPSASVVSVGGLNQRHIHIADMDKHDKCGKCWGYFGVGIVLTAGILFLFYVSSGISSMMQSDTMTTLITTTQSYHKSLYPNTQIDPDILTKEHHQNTVDKIATKRINQTPKYQLSIYDNLNNANKNNVDTLDDHDVDITNDNNDAQDDNQPFIRNYETLRAMHKAPTVYLGRKTHPKLLKQKQKGAQLLQQLYGKKSVNNMNFKYKHKSKGKDSEKSEQ